MSIITTVRPMASEVLEAHLDRAGHLADDLHATITALAHASSSGPHIRAVPDVEIDAMRQRLRATLDTLDAVQRQSAWATTAEGVSHG